ncbi:hypothetical protein [Thermaerobacillus caldiproteolyticus]|uniref:hypothetical protein n=1 Tax=Thermaerobacillus caldiproteolyticus TaxID=247480 RepID=UPI0018F275ED|nr:hypothetical protein [Anoxybacillus caldiproteolyticus]
MKNGYFAIELKRAFFSRNTLISQLLIFACIFIGSFEFIFHQYPGVNAIYLFMYSHSEGTSAILSLLFPVLVSLPFAASYVTDVRTGLINYISYRMSRKKYLLIRLLVNGLVSGYVIASSLLVSFIIFLLIKKFDVSVVDTLNIIVLRGVYEYSPVLFVLIMILNSFVCGVVFSTLALGISTFIHNHYLTIVFPFAFYIISGTLLFQINKFLNSAMLFDLEYYPDLKISYVVLYDLILLIIGVALFFIGAAKHAE